MASDMLDRVRVLIVEDEESLAQALRDSLEENDLRVAVAPSATAAWDALWEAPFDVLVLDVMLPEGDDAGFELARQLRETGFHQPILFLTAREALSDKLRGLSFGEDYLAKPFEVAELVARLRSLLRRGEVRPTVKSWQDVELLVEERKVRHGGRLVRLTAKEYDVLELLMLNPGRVFTRSEIIERVWGYNHDTPSNLVEVYVKNLRQKVRDDLIETVRGLGYRSPG